MTITVHLIIRDEAQGKYSAAFALYVGDNQLFPFESIGSSFDDFFSARFALSDAVAEKIDALRSAEVEFKTERR